MILAFVLTGVTGFLAGGFFGALTITLCAARRQAKLRALLTDLQDKHVTWSRCPGCGGLVACTGWGCPQGICAGCGRIVLESEIEEVDPATEVALLRAPEVIAPACGSGAFLAGCYYTPAEIAERAKFHAAAEANRAELSGPDKPREKGDWTP